MKKIVFTILLGLLLCEISAESKNGIGSIFEGNAEIPIIGSALTSGFEFGRSTYVFFFIKVERNK
jgi:hypothetical protein